MCLCVLVGIVQGTKWYHFSLAWYLYGYLSVWPVVLCSVACLGIHSICVSSLFSYAVFTLFQSVVSVVSLPQFKGEG